MTLEKTEKIIRIKDYKTYDLKSYKGKECKKKMEVMYKQIKEMKLYIMYLEEQIERADGAYIKVKYDE